MQSIYDINQSAGWNCENGPLFEGEMPVRNDFPMKTKLWDFELNSPLGIPAGPLFNSKFVKLYAELGFDVLVYKSVRSCFRLAHPNPNIVYVDLPGQITEDHIGGTIKRRSEPESVEDVTITNSFGMNSLEPKDWQEDIALAQSYLSDGQLMPVSITATPEQGDMKEDFVRVAALAKDAGAKCIIANYSCPNVVTGEGSIYTDPESSSEISKMIKQEIGNIPFVIKLGYFPNVSLYEKIVAKNAPYVQGISAINTIPMGVVEKDGSQTLPGEGRLKSGLCGNAIRDLALKSVERLADIKKRNNYDFEIFGVGGITKPEHVDMYLERGATIAMTGTGALWNPYLAHEYHRHKGGS